MGAYSRKMSAPLEGHNIRSAMIEVTATGMQMQVVNHHRILRFCCRWTSGQKAKRKENFTKEMLAHERDSATNKDELIIAMSCVESGGKDLPLDKRFAKRYSFWIKGIYTPTAPIMHKNASMRKPSLMWKPDR